MFGLFMKILKMKYLSQDNDLIKIFLQEITRRASDVNPADITIINNNKNSSDDKKKDTDSRQRS